MFKKILIANRGEIALRVLRTCKEMEIKSVAVHSTIDKDAMHVRLADEAVCIGPPSPSESYLNIPAIISAAEITGADAIHPGYGFLSENSNFAEIVNEHKINFIGPKPSHISLMGNKIEAKKTVENFDLPVVPGSKGPVLNLIEAKKLSNEIGFPVIIKAAAGGGGRGMKIANSQDELQTLLSIASNEAKNFFGDDTLYIEKFLANPRHIEFQILSDGKGNCIYLGERDCSIQRRHQKIIEETPSPVIPREVSMAMGKKVVDAMLKLEYEGVGTVEFLYEKGKFYFIEMNTRLQVEHTVTEQVTGLDLVKEQIKVSAGNVLTHSQKDINFSGHSIECRINAENPETFIPGAGKIINYHPPGGPGIRIDSALYSGYKIPPNYDSLISKLIITSNSRDDCIKKLKRALEEYVIVGIPNTISLLEKIVYNENFISGDFDINWLENLIKNKKI